MEITTIGTEEQKTVHFDTRLTFIVDKDGNVEGTQTYTEQELYNLMVKSNEPEVKVAETVDNFEPATY